MNTHLKVISLALGGLGLTQVCHADMLDSLPNWATIVNESSATANGVVATFDTAMYLAIGIAVGIFGIKFVIGLFRSM